MKRKIIKQGHNTLTITLPNKWARQYNVKPGNEVDIIEKENGLFISIEKKEDGKTATIDLTGLDVPTIWKYFMAVYREGYDEVIVKFDSNERYDNPYKFFTSHAVDTSYEKRARQHTPPETIQEITSRFIGFEVVEHHKDYCVIKDLAELSSKEFDNSLRRIFLLLLQMGEELIEAINSNKHEYVARTHDIDINIDKFQDYCIRVLNKTGYKSLQKTHLIFASLCSLESLGDEFKNVARHILEDMKGQKLNNLAPLAEPTIEQLKKIYDLYYHFSKEKAVEMSKRDMEIYFYFPKLYKKKPGKKSELSDEELEIFNHFRRISRYINELIELRIEMEF